MKFNREPVYRRSIYPWYDSELACIITILLASVVLFFGAVGISVALKKYEYHPYVWVPILITILSGIIILSNMVRLTGKIFRRFSEKVSRIDIGGN
ncbi:MAG: hypothetical protein JRJ27_15455 [Deltaproteobacteria bacterium]|nr:hypothetical protein [Deltaproteobacteria bacterium]